jgi:hypothetical protein
MKLIYKIALVFLIICFTFSCSLSGHYTVLKIPRLHGLHVEKVIEEFKTPSYSETYTMNEAVGEFRVELYNTYPLTDPKNHEVQIKELWWKDGNYNITVWFHQVNGKWVVLDTCRWHKDVQF